MIKQELLVEKYTESEWTIENNNNKKKLLARSEFDASGNKLIFLVVIATVSPADDGGFSMLCIYQEDGVLMSRCRKYGTRTDALIAADEFLKDWQHNHQTVVYFESEITN